MLIYCRVIANSQKSNYAGLHSYDKRSYRGSPSEIQRVCRKHSDLTVGLKVTEQNRDLVQRFIPQENKRTSGK